MSSTVDPNKALLKLFRSHQAIRDAFDAHIKKRMPTVISSSGKIPGLIQVTPPFSDQIRKQREAKRAGENRVGADIFNVYKTVGGVYRLLRHVNPRVASAYIKAVNSNNEPEQRRLMRVGGLPSRVVEDFDPEIHKRLRDKRGRVRRHYLAQVVRNPRDLQAHVRLKKGRVGTQASFLNRHAAHYGAKGVPAWVKRHPARGKAPVVKSGAFGTVHIMEADMPFGAEDQKRRLSYVVEYRKKALRREMPYVLRQAAKKFQL